MRNLYERILHVLGRPISDPGSTEVMRALGPPSRIWESGNDRSYFFEELCLAYNKLTEQFQMVGFEYNEKEESMPFPDRFHPDLTSEDTPNEVEKKLGVKAKYKTTFEDRTGGWGEVRLYHLPPLSFQCEFEGPSCLLSRITVRLIQNES